MLLRWRNLNAAKALGPSRVVHSFATEAQGHSKRWTMTSLDPGEAVEAAAGSELETAENAETRAVEARTADASAASERLIRMVTPIIGKRRGEMRTVCAGGTPL